MQSLALIIADLVRLVKQPVQPPSAAATLYSPGYTVVALPIDGKPTNDSAAGGSADRASLAVAALPSWMRAPAEA